jgi:hypothetical protein
MPKFILNSSLNGLPSVLFSSSVLESTLKTKLDNGFGFVSYSEFSSN